MNKTKKKLIQISINQTNQLTGVKRKCTNSGAFGSCIHPFNLANKLNANLNLERISKNSSSHGPRARMASNPSPDPLAFVFFCILVT